VRTKAALIQDRPKNGIFAVCRAVLIAIGDEFTKPIQQLCGQQKDATATPVPTKYDYNFYTVFGKKLMDYSDTLAQQSSITLGPSAFGELDFFNRRKFTAVSLGNGQITEVSLNDGSKKVVTNGLSGPIALTMVDGKLYVAEIAAGRISEVDPATGNKVVFFVGVAGKPNAIGNDGSGNLIILDGASQKLFQLNTKNLSLSVIATDLPVGYSVVGSYPPIEFPWPMAVSAKGEVYLPTINRGMIKLQKK
jgi:hypothetical protein